LSLFAISFIAAYREAFETVLFYQSILAGGAPTSAVLLGIGAGAVALVAVVAAYTRAGRFTPPQTFFRVSSWLLYVLAFVFVGQGIASLQKAGAAPVHALPIPLPAVPLLGISPTIETCAAQLVLVVLAVVAVWVGKREGGHAAAARPAAT
jgi:high-affinity iron transporter